MFCRYGLEVGLKSESQSQHYVPETPPVLDFGNVRDDIPRIVKYIVVVRVNVFVTVSGIAAGDVREK